MNLREHLFGHYDDLTPEQAAKAQELLEATKHIPVPPTYAEWREHRPTLFMAKWLYARKWNVADAKEMYLRASSWRLYHRVEDVPLFPSVRPLQGYDTAALISLHGGGRRKTDQEIDLTAAATNDVAFMGWHKWDKAGRPVYVERQGISKVSEIVERYKMLARPEEKFTKRYCDLDRHMNEVGRVLVQHNNQHIIKDPLRFVSEVVAIIDARGLGLHHFAQAPMELMKDSMDVAQSYYPEGLHKVFITNTPPIMSVGWAIVKPWLDKRLQSKIVFLKESETTEALLQHIDADKLPKFLGGTCNCPGGCVPGPGDAGAADRWSPIDKTYLTHPTYVAPGGTSEASVTVGAATQDFRWSFALESHDVDYTVSAVSSDGTKAQQLSASEKARFGFGTVKPFPPSFKCSEATPCRILFRFNNRYSWVNGKHVRHRVEPLAVYEADLERERVSVDPEHCAWM